VTFSAIRGIGLNVSFLQTVFISSLPLFLTTFFIQGIGGFGTVEGGLAVGFIIIGFSKETAISGSFLIHSAILTCLSLLALIVFINSRKKIIT